MAEILSDMFDFTKKSINVAILLFIFALLAFMLRIIPLFLLPDTGYIHVIRGDAEYNLRQIEVMAHNFLQYDWFDPMTAYPDGKNIGWGPLFPMIAGAFVIITGASGQAAIVNAASFVPPLMAAVLVPVVYFIAESVSKSRFAGIIAAALISVSSLFFLNYTSYGYVDHHAAEILFSAIFCMFYIFAVRDSSGEFKPDIKDKEFLKIFAYSVLAGVFYSACYFTSPTTVLFLVLISIFTLFSCIITHNSGNIPYKLGFVNTVAMIIPAIMALIFGIKYAGFAISSYTVVHVIIPVLVIVATWVLILLSFGLGRTNLKDNKIAYPSVLILAGVIALFASAIVVPDIFSSLFSSANLVFGFGNVAIAEMQPMTLDFILQSYQIGLVLGAGGVIVALYKLYSTKENGYLFVLLWMLMTVYVSIKHMRFDYFVAAPFAILSALCIYYVYSRYYGDFLSYLGKEKKPAEGKSKKKSAKANDDHLTGTAIFMVITGITVVFFAASVINDVRFTEDYSGVSFEKDKWLEAMEWMNENTPDPGVDYYGEYSSDSFVYPEDSYGVMSWWDFGHVITLVGKRIPVSNPFQDNVQGDTGCANFLISGSEEEADRIMDNAGARFVVTNSELTTPDKGILTILSWVDPADITVDYMISLYNSDDSGNSGYSRVYTSNYYNTTVVRLQNLDGTYIEPEEVDVITTTTSGGVKSITGYQTVDYDTAVSEATSDDILVSQNPDMPCCTVQALKNYRLVFESSDPDDNVKIFEYVDGYEVPGEGTVELNLKTNAGREFVYAQKSEGGRFILPYSTIGNPYNVTAIGQYHIIETDEYFDVYEEDIGAK
ncbi:Oligosaccharyl transferase STT3 subunit [Methanolacinia petrolearia DSM 11571]|uniref:dolichyl-phosphooligosaccharide-protein glycotransferase n=1 Tax=Methanolacinia petrolearia (strain DSM 11571 / OCM 486 / SEBR 4847) TaxID=679926 RepID=E1REE6_METP4|nr:oligosaccharyl transferase, archaeosortase A system-associated [Methanolacinia petrolearia]ADN37189.1 Oligosaccharyl transferase STT3 subunit [Methanolacinia petrolearia DSM 11571]